MSPWVGGGVAPGQVGPRGSGGCWGSLGGGAEVEGPCLLKCQGRGAPTHLSQQEAASGLDTAPTLTSSHLLYCTLGSWGSMLGGELTAGAHRRAGHFGL